MHGIIKERLFSHFIDEDTRISEENYTKITQQLHSNDTKMTPK